MDQQTSYKTLIGVHLTMHLMHHNEGLATIRNLHSLDDIFIILVL